MTIAPAFRIPDVGSMISALFLNRKLLKRIFFYYRKLGICTVFYYRKLDDLRLDYPNDMCARLGKVFIIHSKDIQVEGNITYLPIYMASLL